jgi:hypothetical protein
MYYITDSRFETKGELYRSLDEARAVLDDYRAALEKEGAIVTPFGYEDPISGITFTGYEVWFGSTTFELMIQVIN